jgi:hypothetical protein
LLDRTHTLPGGDRVRLRLPRLRDGEALGALLERLGVAVADLDARRALRFDPRERLAVCATAWDGHEELLVGFGLVDRASGAVTVLADEAAAPGVRELVARAVGGDVAPRALRVA